jgi:hypothetical protein
MNWTSESKPNDECRYDHTTVITPIGKITIEWKSWKEKPQFDVYLNGEWIGTGNSLEVAKTIALVHLANIADELKEFLS